MGCRAQLRLGEHGDNVGKGLIDGDRNERLLEARKSLPLADVEAQFPRVTQDLLTDIWILREADLEHEAREDDERNFTQMHAPGVL
jgi:hypothetical protein